MIDASAPDAPGVPGAPAAGGLMDGPLAIPCAPTLLRWHVRRLAKLSEGGSSLAGVPAVLRPLVRMRSGALIQAIERTQDIEDLIALAPEAVGAAEIAWHVRLRQFGEPVLPLLVHGLGRSALLKGERRNVFVEHLVAASYWFGEAGADSLLRCFPCLDDYGKSLSCVVMGLLTHRPAADPLADFLHHALESRGDPERLFVGPLWGLVDLDDGRAADAVADLTRDGRWFFELPDFVAVAGDLRCVEPTLLFLAQQSGQEQRRPLMMALAVILQRAGMPGFLAEAAKSVDAKDQAAMAQFARELADKLAPQCEAYLEAVRRS